MLTDEEIAQLLRDAYAAVLESARTDPIVFRDSGVAEPLDAIQAAGDLTIAFFKKCRANQAGKFVEDLPSYEDKTEPAL